MRLLAIVFLVFINLTPLGLSFRTYEAVPAGAKKLMKCYPDFITGYKDNYLLFKNGSKVKWDDGISNKPYSQLLDAPDLKDMFSQAYSVGKLDEPIVKDFEPGRIRNTDFFKAIYGETEADVKKNLVEITWCPKLVGEKISVTRVNDVYKQVERISAELDEHPELKPYLKDIGGSFLWRKIKGTNRQSMHSFGMTIDINTKYSDYWEWTCKCTDESRYMAYKNRIPQLIVDIFERHGFIWGGKWYHYDTMHFEYRPELIN